MAKALTVSMLANLGCAAGIDTGRYNACTAWIAYDLAGDRESLHLRLHDKADSPPLSRSVQSISRAWDADAPADGSEKIVTLPEGVMEMSAGHVRAIIVEQLLELAEL